MYLPDDLMHHQDSYTMHPAIGKYQEQYVIFAEHPLFRIDVLSILLENEGIK